MTTTKRPAKSKTKPKAKAKARRAVARDKTASTKRAARADTARRARRRRAALAQQRGDARHDGYSNPYSGHGTSGDVGVHTVFVPDLVTDIEALDLWESQDICARIIELQPREAMRRGYEIKTDDREVSELIHASCEELQLNERITRAGMVERACGGAAIFPVLDTLDDLAMPLVESSIAKVIALHVLEPRELIPISYYRDIMHPKFGEPERYRLVPLTNGTTMSLNTVIHESRLVIFPGMRVTRQYRRGQRFGWGNSVLSRPQQVIADYGLAWGSAAQLLRSFAEGVLKMDGYAELSADNEDQILDDRFARMEMDASTLRMKVIDKNDEWSRPTTPIGGMAEMMIQMAQRVAAAADIPVTLLMGMSPAGLNATGEMDIRSWYDRCGTTQEYYRPRIEQVLRLLLLSREGPTKGIEPETWSIGFHPMWSPTEKERAETRKIVADTDAVYLDRQVVTPEDVATSRWKGDTYSAEMIIDWDAREKAQAEMDKLAAAAQAGQLAALKAAASPDPDPTADPKTKEPTPDETADPSDDEPLDPDVAKDPEVVAAQKAVAEAQKRFVTVREHQRQVRQKAA